MRNPDDDLFCHVFADPRQARPLLRCALPPQLVDAIDWDAFELAPPDLLAGVPRSRHTSLVFQATVMETGGPVYLILQTRPEIDRDAEDEVHAVVQTVRRHHRARCPDDGPVPVVPLVVVHGPRPWDRAARRRN